jgi:epoxyqueuosine reductase
MEAIRGNAIIALGNIGTDKAIDPLCMTLTHPESQIRAYSAWALGKIGGAEVRKVLETALKDEENREVRKEIQHALGK